MMQKNRYERLKIRIRCWCTETNGAIWPTTNNSIYREHAFQYKSISWIWKEYGLSSSTVKSIIKKFKLNVNRSEIYTNVRCRGLIKHQLVKNIIKRFIDQQWSPFSALDVQNYVKLELKMLITLHQIRGYMKARLGLSYKKGNWRPINLDRQKHEALQQLFVVMLA